jgi:hypothetical protein
MTKKWRRACGRRTTNDTSLPSSRVQCCCLTSSGGDVVTEARLDGGVDRVDGDLDIVTSAWCAFERSNSTVHTEVGGSSARRPDNSTDWDFVGEENVVIEAWVESLGGDWSLLASEVVFSIELSVRSTVEWHKSVTTVVNTENTNGDTRLHINRHSQVAGLAVTGGGAVRLRAELGEEHGDGLGIGGRNDSNRSSWASRAEESWVTETEHGRLCFRSGSNSSSSSSSDESKGTGLHFSLVDW